MHEGLAMNATTGGRSVICLSALLCAKAPPGTGGYRPAPRERRGRDMSRRTSQSIAALEDRMGHRPWVMVPMLTMLSLLLQ